MKHYPTQRSDGRPYFAGLPRETQIFHEAQLKSLQFRPMTTAQANRLEPGTSYWTPIQLEFEPQGT